MVNEWMGSLQLMHYVWLQQHYQLRHNYSCNTDTWSA